MLRNVLVVVGAAVVCTVVISLVQAVGHNLFPPPPGMDVNDPASIAAHLAQIPLGALLMVEAAYAAGSLGAGWVVGRFAAGRPYRLAGGVGALFTALNVWNLVQIPHPLWMAVLTMVTFIPLALLGARLALRPAPAAPAA